MFIRVPNFIQELLKVHPFWQLIETMVVGGKVVVTRMVVVVVTDGISIVDEVSIGKVVFDDKIVDVVILVVEVDGIDGTVTLEEVVGVPLFVITHVPLFKHVFP